MKNTKNSFKIMMDEDEKLHPLPPDIEKSVLGSLQILQMMAQAMELYIPKALEMFVLTLGGTVKELDKASQIINNTLGESSNGADPKNNDILNQND